MPQQVISPNLKGIRAIVTTKWTNKGYRPLTVSSIEGYYVDTALDNDADTWQVEIGDPDGVLMPMIQRDNEVRVQLFGFRPTGASFIVTGVADNLAYSEDGSWTVTGRDLSSLAVDSTVPPQFFKHVRAHAIVQRQAAALGFKKHNLAHAKQVKKKQYSDGSESYWDFWYRLYRKEKMWIWTEPDGRLIAGELNYANKPSYFFGSPARSDAASTKKLYLPIEHAEWAKSTQARLTDVWVYGHRGDNGFLVKEHDPTTKGWIKRTRKIMLDQDAHTPKSASRLGWEEIFEGKVGENELKLTIADPGFEIHQNRTAVVRIPDKGYTNTMFVVGVRQQAGPEGLVVEVRLREKNYAISRRVPKDPRLDTNAPGPKTTLESLLNGAWPSEWSNYFIKAAQNFSGPWNFDLFLATIIAMADKETGGSFINERENGGPGGDHQAWYPWSGTTDPRNDRPQRPPGERDVHGRTHEEWQALFANEPGLFVNRQFGVGPMQLTSQGLKEAADDRLKGNFHNQWLGGRWHPEHNIWVGASYLRSCLKTVVGDSGRDIDMWQGVAAYNAGPGNVSAGAKYAQSVKSKVYDDPGYLQVVQQARDQAKQDRSQPHDPPGRTDTGSFSALVSDTLKYVGPDQGIDFTGAGNVYALGNGVVTRSDARGSGWPGQGALLVYRLDVGVPRGLGIDGRFIYHAEDLVPLVKIGDRIQKGQKIARATGSFLAPGIEIGWARNDRGSAYGTIHDGKQGGPDPIYGKNFRDFVESQ